VVSGLAIHHLVDDRKRELYREIYGLVGQGGIFINDEAVASPPGFKARFEALHYRTMQEQERAKFGTARSVEELRAEAEEQRRLAGQPSHIAPLATQLAWVSEAGFQSVDCFWRYLGMAIFSGIKN
jgi:tRNA (cmo5U34)-methyltransferase